MLIKNSAKLNNSNSDKTKVECNLTSNLKRCSLNSTLQTNGNSSPTTKAQLKA